MHPRAEADAVDVTSKNIDLESTLPGIVRDRPQNAVQVLLLHTVGIDQHQFTNSQPNELFHHRTPCSRAADDCYAELAKQLGRALAKELSVPLDEGWHRSFLSTTCVDTHIVPDDRQQVDGREDAPCTHHPSKDAPVRQHDGTCVWTFPIYPAVHGLEEPTVGVVVNG